MKELFKNYYLKEALKEIFILRKKNKNKKIERFR